MGEEWRIPVIVVHSWDMHDYTERLEYAGNKHACRMGHSDPRRFHGYSHRFRYLLIGSSFARPQHPTVARRFRQATQGKYQFEIVDEGNVQLLSGDRIIRRVDLSHLDLIQFGILTLQAFCGDENVTLTLGAGAFPLDPFVRSDHQGYCSRLLIQPLLTNRHPLLPR